MTTGQRIAAKRKEQNLSQEGLGEVLGVSRQSIYKWESDTSLPDIDKLVTLSRLFQVSVGWLLGVEDEPESPKDAQLSEAQLNMVEEILSRYQQANQATLSDEQQAQVDRLVEQKLTARAKPPRKRSTRILLALAILWAGWFAYEQVTQLYGEYRMLANSVDNLNYSVDQQIDSITRRVEEILKSQNELTADYSAELLSADLAQNTITFSLRAVPKTYVEGMEVVFLADCGDGPLEFPGKLGQGHEFTAEVTCPLTDSITLSAVFVNGDTRQTQLLDNYEGLSGCRFPTDDATIFFDRLWETKRSEDGMFHLPEDTNMVVLGRIALGEVYDTKLGPNSVQDIQLGLFHNRKLLQWMEPCDRPEDFHINPEPDAENLLFFHQPEISLTMEEGDTLIYAALITDQYGHTAIIPEIPWGVREGDELRHAGGDATPYYDISNYTFDLKE